MRQRALAGAADPVRAEHTTDAQCPHGWGNQLCFQVKHLGQLALNHARPPWGSSKWQQWVAPCWGGQRHPPTDLTCCLQKFAACWGPGSGMLQGDHWGLPDPLTNVLWCSYQWYCWGNLESIKADYRALGVIGRGMGTWIMLSSTLPVWREKHVKNWLWSWGQQILILWSCLRIKICLSGDVGPEVL